MTEYKLQAGARMLHPSFTLGPAATIETEIGCAQGRWQCKETK